MSLLGRRGVVTATALLALGAAAWGISATIDAPRAWGAYLIAAFLAISVALVGAFFLSIHAIARAGWCAVFQRVPESMAAYVLPGAILMGALAFGVHGLYHWTHPGDDPILLAKRPYLNETAFLARLGGILVLWIALSWAVASATRRQGLDGRPAGLTRPLAFVIGFAITFTVASVDWFMSLEPHWFSTLYPWYLFSSVLVAGVATMILLVAALRRRGVLPEVNENHLHDLGKYLFAFSCFWGYLWYSQYMLIWYSNLPEETTHYLARDDGAWGLLFVLNAAVNLGVPMFLLLPAAWKRHERYLSAMAALLIAGHWLDLYLLVMPVVHPEEPRVGLPEIGAAVAFGALFVLVFDRAIRRAPARPTADPFYEESVHHHVV